MNTETKKTKVCYVDHKITVRDYLDKLAKGQVNTQAPYQRPDVKAWNSIEKMTMFHDSIVSGRHIPHFLFRVTEDGKMESIDGNQRTRCLKNIHLGIGVDLPLDDDFYLRELDFREIVGADDEEVQKIYRLLNKEGEKMSLAQVRHGEYYVKLSGFLSHAVWEILKFENPVKESVLMQLSNSLWSDVPDFSSKNLVDWFVKYNLTPEQNQKIVRRLDVLQEILSVKTTDDDAKAIARASKKVHIESILSCIVGNETQTECEKINLWLALFFSQQRDSRTEERITYVDASKADSAASKNIKTRHDIMRMVVSGDPSVYQPKVIAKPVNTTPLTDKKSKGDEILDRPDSDYAPGDIYYAVDGKGRHLVQAEPTCKSASAARANLIDKFKKPARSADLTRWVSGGNKIVKESGIAKSINPIVGATTVQPTA
jgi:hypothetical protein